MNFKYNPKFEKLDFVTHRKKFFIATAIVTIVGTILLFTLGLNLGIDFRSGSTIDILADHSLTESELVDEFESIGLKPDEVTLAGDNNERGRVELIGSLTQEEVLTIQNHFEDAYGNKPTINTVTPLVGKELAKNGVIAVLLASLGIVIYISFRFQYLYGIAAIIALLFDAWFVLIVFSILQIEVNIPFIAAVLTVVGYSINDKIVTFDRIRENLKFEKKVKGFDDLARVVNESLKQTLTRTINTVLTVLFAAVALFLFGGESIRSFSFAIVIGLLAGTYSSMFIAAQLWLIFKTKQLEKQKKRPVQQTEG